MVTTNANDYDPRTQRMTRYVPFGHTAHPTRFAFGLSADERDGIGVFCTAVGARWGNWCRDPGTDRTELTYIGTFFSGGAVEPIRLRWTQDNVWQLASQYYHAFRSGTHAMRVPADEVEAWRFEDEAHDPAIYNAVKKLMRFKYGPRWVQADPRERAPWSAKQARLEQTRHEVAAMAHGRMHVRSWPNESWASKPLQVIYTICTESVGS